MTSADWILILGGVAAQVITTLRKGKSVEQAVGKKVDDAENALSTTVLRHGVKIDKLSENVSGNTEVIGHLKTQVAHVQVVVKESVEDLKRQFEDLVRKIDDANYKGPRVDLAEDPGRVVVKETPAPPVGKVIRKP